LNSSYSSIMDWLVLVRSAIKDRNRYLCKVDETKNKSSCTTVSPSGSNRQTFLVVNQINLWTYIQGGDQNSEYICKKKKRKKKRLYFVPSNFIYFPPLQITLSAQCKLETVT